MAMRRLVPLLDRVLVQKVEAATKTAGGLLLPETTAKVSQGRHRTVAEAASLQGHPRALLPARHAEALADRQRPAAHRPH